MDVSNCIDYGRVEIHAAQLIRSPLDKATSTTLVYSLDYFGKASAKSGAEKISHRGGR